MRKLMWFTIGFAFACGLCAYLLWDGRLWLCALAALALCVSMGRSPKRRIARLILLGVAVGFCWFGGFRQFYLRPLESLDTQTVSAQITADQYSEKSLYGSSVDGTIRLSGRTYRVRVYLKGEPGLNPGDSMEGEFRLRLTTPGGKKESTYYQGNGIFLIASQVGELTVHRAQTQSLRHVPAIWAKRAKQILQEALPADVAPFAQALLLGDDSEMDYTLETAFRISGIRHIIAVSGMHVAILFGLVIPLTGNRRYATSLAAFPILLLFVAMVGFTASASRAFFMLALVLAARVLNREYDTFTGLAFACLLLLAGNPFVITSVSLQLSVLSVAGILLFQSKIYGYLTKRSWPGWLAASVSVTLSATLLSTPLSAWYFGAVSLVGVITNVLTLWAVSLVFGGLLLLCLLGAVWMPGAALLGSALAVPIRYILIAARWIARLPMAAVYTKSIWIVLWLVGVYLLLACAIFKKGRPAVYGAVCAVGLCLAVLLSCLLPRQYDCCLTVLDVGQGQSLLIQSQGKTLLIDCGGYSDTGAANMAAETLLSQSIYKLDAIVLTHYDSDHMAGLPHLLTRVGAERIYLPQTQDRAFGEKLAALSHAEPIYLQEDCQFPLGSGAVTLLVDEFGKDDNENSLGILFETADCAILCTGDRSKSGEKRLLDRIPDVDVLIAGHHGSKNANSDALLDAAAPEVVIISVGAGNSYGHPAPETLERLAAHGCTVLRTDELGTIVYRR